VLNLDDVSHAAMERHARALLLPAREPALAPPN
jgi:hypothetical protein